MADVAPGILNEHYQLKSTFFYNRLEALGFSRQFLQVQDLARHTGAVEARSIRARGGRNRNMGLKVG